MENVELAVFRPQTPGELRVAELMAGTLSHPRLLVEFKVPDALKSAEVEAAARRNIQRMREVPDVLRRYGLPATGVSEDSIDAAFLLAISIESAIQTWVDWNYSLGEGKAELIPENIAGLLGDPEIRSIWDVHFRNSTALERAEKNGSGASLNTNSDEAPNTAADASGSTRPAQPASVDGRASSARASKTSRKPPKA